MKKFIDLVENALALASQQTLGCAFKDGLTVSQAEEMLSVCPDGILSHPAMEESSFIAITQYGMLIFYDAHMDRFLHWDWKSDIEDMNENGDVLINWTYYPADEWFPYVNGGMDWWHRIRQGLEVPVAD